jgi:hypothetical protein
MERKQPPFQQENPTGRSQGIFPAISDFHIRSFHNGKELYFFPLPLFFSPDQPPDIQP